jgi:2'-5' RNA ligase
VIGDIDPDRLDEIANEAQQVLRRPVNITRLRPTAWAAQHPQPFVQAVRSGPLVALRSEEGS